LNKINNYFDNFSTYLNYYIIKLL